MHYLSYGSNMHHEWMQQLCPGARCIGVSVLQGYCLSFKGWDKRVYATLEKTQKLEDVVPVVLWEITAQHEQALDAYEDYPQLYRKEEIRVTINQRNYSAMLYIMNGGEYNAPSEEYYAMLVEAYQTNGFDAKILLAARDNTTKGE